MQQIELYISLAVTVLGFIATTITFLTKFVKNAKTRKRLEQLLQITGDVMALIEQAETFTHYTGAEKKAFVMTKLWQSPRDQKLQVSPSDVSNQIDALVHLTKQVNVGQRTKELAALK